MTVFLFFFLSLCAPIQVNSLYFPNVLYFYLFQSRGKHISSLLISILFPCHYCYSVLFPFPYYHCSSFLPRLHHPIPSSGNHKSFLRIFTSHYQFLFPFPDQQVTLPVTNNTLNHSLFDCNYFPSLLILYTVLQIVSLMAVLSSLSSPFTTHPQSFPRSSWCSMPPSLSSSSEPTCEGLDQLWIALVPDLAPAPDLVLAPDTDMRPCWTPRAAALLPSRPRRRRGTWTAAGSGWRTCSVLAWREGYG